MSVCFAHRNPWLLARTRSPRTQAAEVCGSCLWLVFKLIWWAQRKRMSEKEAERLKGSTRLATPDVETLAVSFIY